MFYCFLLYAVLTIPGCCARTGVRPSFRDFAVLTMIVMIDRTCSGRADVCAFVFFHSFHTQYDLDRRLHG